MKSVIIKEKFSNENEKIRAEELNIKLKEIIKNSEAKKKAEYNMKMEN